MSELPTTAQYKAGLQRLDASIHPNHRAMLLAHFRAPDHTITARELAKVADYKDWNGANLQYGTFAYNLGQAIGWSSSPDVQYSYIIADFTEPLEPGQEWLWHMHPDLSGLIGELGWR